MLAGGNDIFRLLDDLKTAATTAGESAFGNALAGGLTLQVPGYTAQTGVDIGTALLTAAATPGATTTSIVTAAVTKAIMLGAPVALATPGNVIFGLVK